MVTASRNTGSGSTDASTRGHRSPGSTITSILRRGKYTRWGTFPPQESAQGGISSRWRVPVVEAAAVILPQSAGVDLVSWLLPRAWTACSHLARRRGGPQQPADSDHGQAFENHPVPEGADQYPYQEPSIRTVQPLYVDHYTKCQEQHRRDWESGKGPSRHHHPLVEQFAVIHSSDVCGQK